VVVAALWKSMEFAIPQVIDLLSIDNDSLRKAGVEVLLNLSYDSSTSRFLA